MRRTIILTALLVAMGAGAYCNATTTTGQANTTAGNTLKDVTLFNNGAEMHHTETAHVAAGSNTVRIEGLSPYADLNTLQISLSAGATLSGHSYDVCTVEQSESESLKALTADSARIADECATLRQSLAVLEEGVKQSISGTPKPSKEAINQALSYYESRAQKIQERIREASDELRRCNKAIAQARKEQQDRQNATQKGVLTLYINSKSNSDVRIDVKYFSHMASWSMQYDAHIADIGAPIVFAKKAALQQHTGIDWTNIRLTLSTASPRRGLTAPEPTPWIVRQQTVYPRAKSARLNYAAPMAGSADFVMMDVETAAEESMMTDNYISKEYPIGDNYSIAGNGKTQVVPLEEIRLSDIAYTCYTLPRQDERVYLTAKVSVPDDADLPAGNVAVIFRNTYYGEQYIQPSADEKTVTLTLGEEQSLLVTRERIAEYTSEKQLQKDKISNQAYCITLRNTSKTAREVTVEECYPVSSSSEIRVNLSDQTTPTQKTDKEKGILTYTFTLQPGESKQLTVGYSIRYPKDWNIR
ncbi:MAG: mucoidy inhibitor MuiA family protein [Paludibacteraceae bacterium]